MEVDLVQKGFSYRKVRVSEQNPRNNVNYAYFFRSVCEIRGKLNAYIYKCRFSFAIERELITVPGTTSRYREIQLKIFDQVY